MAYPVGGGVTVIYYKHPRLKPISGIVVLWNYRAELDRQIRSRLQSRDAGLPLRYFSYKLSIFSGGGSRLCKSLRYLFHSRSTSAGVYDRRF